MAPGRPKSLKFCGYVSTYINFITVLGDLNSTRRELFTYHFYTSHHGVNKIDFYTLIKHK